MAINEDFGTVAVIGNGLMGHGISQVFAAGGKRVHMIGRDQARLTQALDKIRGNLAESVAEELLSPDDKAAALERIVISTKLEDASVADLVVEAVTEDLSLKHEIFEKLDNACPPKTVLASSSGQPASALVQRVRRRERVLATHFWYPAHLIPLVEVCPGPETDPQVVRWTVLALRSVGVEPVVMEKEVPGLIGNRIQFAMLREAWSLWASGAASAEAIDSVVRNTLGRRLGITGPLESADLGGLDTLHSFAESLLPHLSASPKPAPEVTELVRQGHRGPSTGKGVHCWSERDGEAIRAARVKELFRWLRVDREAIRK